jgi:hypothetical protein
MDSAHVFILYSGHDAFEASLLQHALEHLLADKKVIVWTFQRDQSRTRQERMTDPFSPFSFAGLWLVSWASEPH